MSDILFTLDDRTILDNGLVVFTDTGLIQLARNGASLDGVKALESPETVQFNLYSNEQIDTSLVINQDNWFDWNTPEPFSTMDVHILLRGMVSDPVYEARLEQELTCFEERGMIALIRHTLYLIDYMTNHGVIWGVGRGSSSASLILYLIGLHRIDPILYNIPLNEFIKSV